MTARIVMTAGGPPAVGSVTVPATTVVTLSNQDDTGVLAWRWSLTDKPEGSSAALSSGTAAAPTLTPDIPGTYMVTLSTYRDLGASVLDGFDFQAVRVRYTGTHTWALPGAGETTQFDPAVGWKKEVNEILADIRATISVPSTDVVSKWSETDTTQFSDAYVQGGDTLSLTQTTNQRQRVLRVHMIAVGAGEHLFALALTGLSLPALNADPQPLRRFRFKMSIVGTPTGDLFNQSNAQLGVGIGHYGGGSNFWAVIPKAYALGGNFQSHRYTAGVHIQSGNTPGGRGIGNFAADFVAYDAASPNMGQKVEWESTWNIKQATGAPANFEAMLASKGSSATPFDGCAPYDNDGEVSVSGFSNGAFGASWNNLVLDQVIIGIRVDAAGTYDLDLADLMVLKHPMDT